MRKFLLPIIMLLMLGCITSFLLGNWKLGIGIGVVLTWVLKEVAQYYSDKNQVYLFEKNKHGDRRSYKKYGD